MVLTTDCALASLGKLFNIGIDRSHFTLSDSRSKGVRHNHLLPGFFFFPMSQTALMLETHIKLVEHGFEYNILS